MSYLLSRFVGYRGDASAYADGGVVFVANPIAQAWEISRVMTVGLVLIGLASYVLPLLFAIVLARVVGDGVELVVDAQNVLALGGIALISFVLTLIRLDVENLFSMRVCQKIDRLFSHPLVDTGPIEKIERIALRDVNTVLDSLCSTLDLVVLPLFLAGVMGMAMLLLGDAGLICVAVLVTALPISYCIGKCASANFEIVMLHAARRIERCSRWISIGPVMRQFGRSPLLDLIDSGLSAELKSRDVDACLRGIDSSLIGFGRLLPIAVLAMAGAGASLNMWSGSVAWLAIPVLVGVLHWPRAYVSFRSASVSLKALADVSKTTCATPVGYARIASGADTKSFVFDELWPMWPTKLRELLPDGAMADMHLLGSLVVAFRLIPELGDDLDKVLEKNITLNGSNLSRGQRCRVQLLRGLFVAKASARTMVVSSSLASLDAGVRASVLRALKKHANVVIEGQALQACTDGAELAIGDHSGDGRQCFDRKPLNDATHPVSVLVRSEGRLKKNFGLLSLLRLACPGIALFIVPAVMLAYSANLVQDAIGVSPWLLLIYVLTGIALSTVIGLFVERRIRFRLARGLLNGLENIVEDMSSFSLHVVSRDLTTVFERIAWYAHDIAWISALLIVSMGSLWSGFGFVGAGVTALTLSALAMLYMLSTGELQRTRLASVEGVDTLIKSVRTAHLIQVAHRTALGSVVTWLNRKRSDALGQGVAAFYETRTRSIVARTTAVATSSLILSSALVGLVLVSLVSGAAAEQVIAPITILLLIQSDFYNAFLAITGLRSQAISVDRVERFAQAKRKVHLERHGTAIKIATVHIERVYRSHAFQVGHCYSLHAPSGQGKTRYLKAVAGIVSQAPSASTEPREEQVACASHPRACAGVKCYYLDQSVLMNMFGFSDSAKGSSSSIDRLMAWIDAVTKGDASVLLLMDEIFTSFDVDQVRVIYLALAERLACTQSVVIAVDHRVCFARSLPLSNICDGVSSICLR